MKKSFSDFYDIITPFSKGKSLWNGYSENSQAVSDPFWQAWSILEESVRLNCERDGIGRHERLKIS